MLSVNFSSGVMTVKIRRNNRGKFFGLITVQPNKADPYPEYIFCLGPIMICWGEEIAMNVPAIIGYPIRALLIVGLLIYLAVGSVIAAAWYSGEWFVDQVRG